MKKYIVRVILFFLVVAIIDMAFGKSCDYFYKHSKGGDTYKINYAVSESNADVLVMGSSRANHHYNPKILSDSLGLSVYNMGIDGSGVILMDGFYRLITQRYVPKCIIYELTPCFDFQLYDGDANNTRYLSQLKPYYRNESISQIFDDIDTQERIKLHSGLYRYNTSFLNLLRFYLKGGNGVGDGYDPLQGEMKEYIPTVSEKTHPIDSLKLKYFHQFIKDCREHGTKLVFVISPKYGATSSSEYQPGIDICDKEGFEVIDCYSDSLFVSNKELFKDSFHMNSRGADVFTKMIAQRIKEIINQD